MGAQIPKILVFGGSDQTWTAAAAHPPLPSLRDAFLKGLCYVGAHGLETLAPASRRLLPELLMF